MKQSKRQQQKRKNRQQEIRDERAREAEQQKAARVNALMVGTTSTIYAALVAKEWDGEESDIPDEVLQKLVKLSSRAANVWGQTIGLLPPTPEINPSHTPSQPTPSRQTDDEMNGTSDTQDDSAEISPKPDII